MGEHLPCKQGVMGSNPIISIKRAERSGWKTGLSGLLGEKKGFEKERFPKSVEAQKKKVEWNRTDLRAHSSAG